MPLALIVLGGCATIEGVHRAPLPQAPGGVVRAGAAEVDITPPLGYALGGHSWAGTVGSGFWTRLRAQSLYVEDPNGSAVVFVSADLWAMSAGLADRVVEIVQRQTDCRHLGREHFVIAATHTHHSPANFSSSFAYNFLGAKTPGFDQRLFDHFAERLATVAVESVRRRVPARLRFAEVAVGDVSRNRSFAAFLRNPEAADIIVTNGGVSHGPVPADLPSPDAVRAVDPRLRSVWIESQDEPGKVIGAIGLFAVHPTAMAAASGLYHGDTFGIATRVAAGRFAPRQRPVIALFNSAEGDVSPNWAVQDRATTEHLGALLGNAIADSHSIATSLPASFQVRARFDRLPIAAQHTWQPPVCRTAAEPAIGPAMLGGAEDGRSKLHARGCVEGVVGERRGEQGNKANPAAPLSFPYNLFLRLGYALLPKQAPRVIPLGVVNVGPIVFATLPGEFTTTLGHRVTTAVRVAANQVDPNITQVVTVGLANEYLSYFTTPEEYEAQHYEGASTLYGPCSGPLVVQALARLARSLAGPAPSLADAYSYETGFSGCDRRATRLKAEPYAEGFANALVADGRPSDRHAVFSWRDGEPGWYDCPHRCALTPSTRIEIERDGEWQPLRRAGLEEDDRGFNFVTLVRSGLEGAEWSSYWRVPEDVADGSRLRFRIKRLDHGEVCSHPFDPLTVRYSTGLAPIATAGGCNASVLTENPGVKSHT